MHRWTPPSRTYPARCPMWVRVPHHPGEQLVLSSARAPSMLMTTRTQRSFLIVEAWHELGRRLGAGYADGGSCFMSTKVTYHSVEDFRNMTATAGASYPSSHYEHAAEYYQFDRESGAKPEETSRLASSWVHTCSSLPQPSASPGEDSAPQQSSSDKLRLQSWRIKNTSLEFSHDNNVRLNATVNEIHRSKKGVTVPLADGTTLSADHALCIFSLGVLQHDDVKFVPAWKQEAIHNSPQRSSGSTRRQAFPLYAFSTTSKKICDQRRYYTQMGLYTDHEQGRYPVWQLHPAFFPGCGIFVTVMCRNNSSSTSSAGIATRYSAGRTQFGLRTPEQSPRECRQAALVRMRGNEQELVQ
ncbi:hypothetical protein C8Q74DRAFT_1220446 [Fomes fomentarius]|nr:hypothetical protein C8Q74DRAFT_1220446 [Fomes fomentarius]